MSEAGEPPDEPSALEIQSTGPGQGMVATLLVGSEQVRIQSIARDGWRDAVVQGFDGTSYATWHMALENLETTGTYGDRSFGQWEDRDTDGDTAAWRALASSHIGEVLYAVSNAANAAVRSSNEAAELDDELKTVGKIYASLLALTETETDEASYNECYFGYGDLALWGWATNYDDYGYCTFNKDARTCAPNTGCTRTYYVSLYRDSSGELIAHDSNSSGGCARTFHQGTGNGCFSWTSKHWDSLNPGGPHWKHESLCCDTRIVI